MEGGYIKAAKSDIATSLVFGIHYWFLNLIEYLEVHRNHERKTVHYTNPDQFNLP